MCGINLYNTYHTWTYFGDPNYFPYKGILCDCGLAKWGNDYGENNCLQLKEIEVESFNQPKQLIPPPK